jgi:hypothetical protein
LNGTDTAPVVSVGGESVYAGVYGGGTSNTANNPIICDDFQNTVGVPSSWTASEYLASTVGGATPVSDLLFGGSNAGYANIGLTGYAEVAYLVELEFNTSSPATQALISEAIWAITDPGLLGSGGTDPISSAAQVYVSDAVTHVTNNGDSMSQYTNLEIFTPNPVSGANNGQEMWMEIPEGGPAALYLLLAGLACFGAMRLSSRNQFGSRAAA